MSSAATTRRNRPGRPRHIEPSDDTLTPREQILDAAARLFTRQGFAATSTREIADEVGIRQASLYYHFAGKDEIVDELLRKTVRPTLDSLDELAQIEPDAERRLYALAYLDARTLAQLKNNIGMLPALPDLPVAIRKEYAAARRELRDAYAGLGLTCASAAVVRTVSRIQLGNLILENVESVVTTRKTDDLVSDRELHNVAATCLRVCGVTDDRVEAARAATYELLPELARAGL